MTASGESGHLTRSKALCGTPAAETLSRRAATFKCSKSVSTIGSVRFSVAVTAAPTNQRSARRVTAVCSAPRYWTHFNMAQSAALASIGRGDQ